LLLPLLQHHCGAGEQVPLLLGVEADDLEARKLVLKLGANDFWLTSAPPSELLRKLRLQLDVHQPGSHESNGGSATPPSLSLLDLRLDPQQRRVWRNRREIALTEREFALLQLLLEHQGTTVARQQILEQVWGHGEAGANANVIEVYVRYLRRKLEENGERRLIHTVRGQGYVLKAKG
jgi:two-component system response regulator MprA